MISNISAAIPVMYLFLFGTPYNRGFFCDDVTLSYPYKPDSVSSHVLVVGGFAISVFVVGVQRKCLFARAYSVNIVDERCYLQIHQWTLMYTNRSL